MGSEDEHQNIIRGGEFQDVVMARDIANLHVHPPPSQQARPQQLAPRLRPFVGRVAELEVLLQLLGPQAGGGAGVVVGLPGVGKTALATEAGHMALERGWFRGGHMFLDLRGYDPVPLSAYDALGQLLRDLGVAVNEIRGEERARAAQFRSELARREEPLLIVLDNVSRARQVAPVLPGEGRHRVLVTSRHSLPQLDARVLSLGVLSPEESIALIDGALRNRSGDDTRFQDQPTAATEVVRLCGYLPLALRIATALLASATAKPLAELADELAAHGARVDRLDDEENAVRAAFDLSYQRLAADEATLFRLLSLNSSPGISLTAAAALAGLPEQAARALLDRLAAAHLLDQGTDRSRWTMHDLLWEYAALAVADEPEGSREEARDRLLDYYNQTAALAAEKIEPSGQNGPSGAIRPRTAGLFDTDKAAIDWLNAERVNLVAAVTAAAEHGRDTVAWELAAHLSFYLQVQHRSAEKLATDQVRLDIARHRRNQPDEADVLSMLGFSLHLLSRFAEAADHYRQALAIDRSLGDRRREAWDLTGLGKARRGLGKFAAAETNLRAAAELHAAEQDNDGRRDAMTELAMTLEAAGREGDAWQISKEATARSGEPARSGQPLKSIFDLYPGNTQFVSIWGGIQLQIEKLNAARRAVEEARRSGDRHAEAEGLLQLSEMRRQRGMDVAEAMRLARQAAAIFGEFHDGAGEARAYYALGQACRDAKLIDEALAAHRTAARLAEHAGTTQVQAQVLEGIGSLLTAMGRQFEGVTTLRRSVELFRDVGDAHGGGRAMSALGLALLDHGRYDEAAAACRSAIALCRSAGELFGRGSAQINLSIALLRAARYQESIAASREALAMCRELNYQKGAITALLNLGFACLKEGRYRESMQWYEQGLERIPEQDHAQRGHVKGNLGKALVKLGNVDAGVESAMEAADEHAAVRDYGNAGLAHWQAGEVLLNAKRYQESIAANIRAVDLLAAAGDREKEARALLHLGLGFSLLRRWDEGNQAYERAYALSKQRGDRKVAALARAVLGGNLVDSGSPAQALPHLRWALEEGQRIGDAHVQQTATHNLEVAHAKLAQRKGMGGGPGASA